MKQEHDYSGALDEEWKPIKGFEEYSVSNFGRVKGKRGDIMLPQRHSGYLAVGLNRQRKLVHRVVAENFIGEIPKGYCVAHIDGVRDNNLVTNLMICTYKENESHKKQHGTALIGEANVNAAFTQEQANAIRIVRNMISEGNVMKFYNLFDVNESTVKRAATGKTYCETPAGWRG